MLLLFFSPISICLAFYYFICFPIMEWTVTSYNKVVKMLFPDFFPPEITFYSIS